MMGQYDIGGDEYDYIARKNAEYDVDSTVMIKEGPEQRQMNKVSGTYSKMASQINVSRSVNSELFENRTDAAMEMDSMRQSKDVSEQRYFTKEPAVFDKISEQYEREESQHFLMKEEALNEQVHQSAKHADT